MCAPLFRHYFNEVARSDNFNRKEISLYYPKPVQYIPGSCLWQSLLNDEGDRGWARTTWVTSCVIGSRWTFSLLHRSTGPWFTFHPKQYHWLLVFSIRVHPLNGKTVFVIYGSSCLFITEDYVLRTGITHYPPIWIIMPCGYITAYRAMRLWTLIDCF